MTAQAHRAKPSFNDFGKSKANTEPPEKNLGLNWDAIKTAYESRLDWEEANGLNPVERQERIPETEEPTPPPPKVKRSVKQGVKRKRGRPAKPKQRPLDNPNRRTADRGRILKLHKQGLSNTQIAKEIGFSQQVVSTILTQEFGIYAEAPKMCGAGLHSMEEFGAQRYVIKPDGSKVKNGRICKACRRKRDRKKNG